MSRTLPRLHEKPLMSVFSTARMIATFLLCIFASGFPNNNQWTK
jgi:hypothetical protein